MRSHIVTLTLVNLLRASAGAALGGFLIYRGFSIPFDRIAQLEPWDRPLFLALGTVWALLALARGLQAVATLAIARREAGGLAAGRGRAVRRLGVWLSTIDLCDPLPFPITTGCGMYGLLVFRHPDALDFFEGMGTAGPSASLRPPP